jgi:hypothetical protein
LRGCYLLNKQCWLSAITIKVGCNKPYCIFIMKMMHEKTIIIIKLKKIMTMRLLVEWKITVQFIEMMKVENNNSSISMIEETMTAITVILVEMMK